MAKILASLIVIALLAGCQEQSSPALSPPPPSPALTSAESTRPLPAPAPRAKPAPEAKKPAPRPDVPPGWIPPIPPNNWQWIVIHHSATPAGSAAVFDREHRRKGWDELGYHFVIGNGTASSNGQIEVGPRWTKQKWGAHARTADQKFNNYGIGICLVGSFDLDRPTPAQTQALVKLVAHLMRTYNIPASRVLGHGDTKPTECPGRNLHVAEIRRQAAALAGMDLPPELSRQRLARLELLKSDE